ncbi:porin [Vibrio hepatarius]|uniref:porin n=1 Tax=Vibrio hepatarius TaxID=171383 RepID=UPI001C083545|nr:porin [Vibrio hepatarius]MBU2899378.1 porin [Vibrio hepatarius]
MKKTILSVAVGMASFGAFAAQGVVAPAHDTVTQSIENVDVFGKLGVSYDDFDASVASGDADDKGIDYKRNTEIGLQTSADLSHGLKASAVVVGNFDNADEDFRLDKVEMGVEHDLATLHFGKIDDRYDQATGKFDQFSEVFNGTYFEGYNSTGKVDGVALSASPLAGLGLALQLGDAEIGDLGDDVAVTATYHFAGIDMAGAYRSVDKGVATNALQDAEAFKLGAGYGFSGLYAGLVYESAEHFDKSEVETIGLSASYKYEALTVKAGYLTNEYTIADNSKFDVDTLRFAAQYDLQENVELHAGYAKVDSDNSASEEDLFTAGMIVRF